MGEGGEGRENLVRAIGQSKPSGERRESRGEKIVFGAVIHSETRWGRAAEMEDAIQMVSRFAFV